MMLMLAKDIEDQVHYRYSKGEDMNKNQRRIVDLTTQFLIYQAKEYCRIMEENRVKIGGEKSFNPKQIVDVDDETDEDYEEVISTCNDVSKINKKLEEKVKDLEDVIKLKNDQLIYSKEAISGLISRFNDISELNKKLEKKVFD